MATAQIGSEPANPRKDWQKTSFSNLIRYVPSGTYYARLKVRGKLIRRSLKTNVMSTAKLRLADFEKGERQRAESGGTFAQGKMTIARAMETHLQRVAGDLSIKPRTRDYHDQRITALKKSWPGLEKLEIRSITKPDCFAWAARFGAKASPSAFNHTLGIFKTLMEIGIEFGARHDNPAKALKRARERSKKLILPETKQFQEFLKELENGTGRFSQACADLVRFLAFGGFRKSEAARITWADCDMAKGEITVLGDPGTGTKNGTIRYVPMIPDMVTLLNRLRAEREGDGNTGMVMKVRECQKSMDRAAVAVAMERITHHDLRHLFATRCIESGIDIPTVSRWLGHVDGGALAMKTYGHLRNEHSQAMAQKVRFG